MGLFSFSPVTDPPPHPILSFFLFRDTRGWVVLNPYRLYHYKPPLRGRYFLAALSPLKRGSLACRPRAKARGIHGREA